MLSKAPGRQSLTGRVSNPQAVTALTINGTLNTYEERGEKGDAVYVRRRFCPNCGSSVVSELAQRDGIVAVKAGVLDDKSQVKPAVEVWCVDRQPWVSLPGMAVSLDREG